MSKRDQSKNVVQNSFIPASGPVAALGHAGHVLTAHADYAVWCETDNAFVNVDILTTRPPGK